MKVLTHKTFGQLVDNGDRELAYAAHAAVQAIDVATLAWGSMNERQCKLAAWELRRLADLLDGGNTAGPADPLAL